MLPTLGAPNKKSTPEQQMAMMRTYLNQLKDDTEGELYNIRWENLSKPLKEKIDSLDREVVALNDNAVSAEWVNANTVSAAYIEANYVATNQLDAQVAALGYVTANYVAANYVTTNYLTANYVTTNYLTSNYITANAIASTYVQASVVDADYIVGKFTTANTAIFNRINLGTLPYSNQTSSLRINVGQTYANVYLKATGTANQYYLVVNMPD